MSPAADDERYRSRVRQFAAIDIYPVVSSEFTGGRPSVDVLKAIADGGARIVQLREKNVSKRELLQLAFEYRTITEQYGMLLIINDHVDVAMAVNADGVHLGQDDLPVAVARELSPGLLLGMSTHSRAEAMAAIKVKPDYINLGPIYATQTKDHALATEGIGTSIIRTVKPLLPFPFTVMGGIKEAHLEELIALGATKIAMVTAITLADDISAKVRQLRRYFTANQ